MKKFLAIAASATLAVSLFAFTGCADKTSDYEIKGDYKEATQEDLNEISDINVNFGDTSAENYVLGLDIKAKLEGSYSTGDTLTASGDLNLGYLYNQTDDSIKGAGEATANFNATYNGQEMKGSYGVKAYNDDEYAYANVTSGETAVISAKVAYWQLFGEIMDLVPSSVSLAESVENSTMNLLALAQQYKIGVGVDKKDGWKFKLSVTTDTINALIDSYVTDETENATIKGAITYNKFVCDAYISLSEAGTFKQLSLDLNIDVKTKAVTAGNIALYDMTLKLKGGVTVNATTDVVDISSLDTTGYVDYTETLGGLIAGLTDKLPGDNHTNEQV